MADFKPNIYPIMYWGLLYGLAAGLLLFAVYLLSQFITLLWFPVFLAGVIWGGYRNYQKQKRSQGMVAPQRPMQEFREAASDIVVATRDMLAEERSAPGNPPVGGPPETPPAGGPPTPRQF